jgi:hypothetical protein
MLVELHFKDQWSYFEQIALGEEMLAQHSHTVDKRPGGAAQVANPGLVRSDSKQAMLPANPCGVGSHVAFRTAPEEILTTIKGEVRAMRPSLDNAQSKLHGCLCFLR